MVEIILASKSKVRKKILDENNINNRVEPSNVDEDIVKSSLLNEKATPEIISKNLPFSKKANIYYRLKRLIDEKYMGSLFKVLFVSKSKNNFNLGFKWLSQKFLEIKNPFHIIFLIDWVAPQKESTKV